MLCEKCRRRQTEWGTICEECEREEAQVDRKAEITRIINRLKWFSLWMSAEVMLLEVLVLVAGRLSKAPTGLVVAETVLVVIGLMIALYEWWLWHRYAALIKKGKIQTVAYELLHHPKGFWKTELRGYLRTRHGRRRGGLGSILLFIWELRDLKREKPALEILAESDQ